MKISTLLLTGLVLLLFTWTACQKNETNQTTPVQTNVLTASMIKTTTSYTGGTALDVSLCGPGVTKDLCAGQNITMGNVTINKDFASGVVYVTYVATANWYFTNLKLYVGAQNSCAIPVNSTGSAVPGQFPYQANFNAPVQTYTFAISGLSGDCFCVAAHADVAQINNGVTVQTQTAWGDGCGGTRISSKGNWATKFDACIPECKNDGGGFDY